MTQRTAVVIGAASGMGAAVAERLHRDGYDLLLADLSDKGLEPVCARLGAAGASVDITDAAQVAALAGQCAGGVDALVITAGLSMSMGSFERILAVNLQGTARVLDAFLGVMRPGGAGVCLASIAGHLAAPEDEAIRTILAEPLAEDLAAKLRAALPENLCIPGMAYGLSKFGVIQLVKRSGLAWGRRGARICSISPGLIDTPMGHMEREASASADDAVPHGPIPRLGQPTEVANVAAFLCSGHASFVTACDLLVDGGWVGTIQTSGPDSPLAQALAAGREKK